MLYERVICFSVVAVALSASAGCSGSSADTLTATQNVTAQIEGLGDMVADPEMFASAFVAGATPQNREDYGRYIVQIVDAPEISGDLAVVSVKLIGGVASSQMTDKVKVSNDTTEIESVWTVQRVGDEWKIQNAPLP